MSLFQLKNVSKIYVSQGNVSVGVRGINLSFDLGEFVAITGKSGSGKSTILNILSGMDSYEEGEFLVEGKLTSHYSQNDWEEYREKYISFIFQDYNILESFTVLQNVELALLNIISDPKQRKKRAIQLIKQVGLEKQLHSKGSKLSGGQKQKTVIARALAKDAKIILADEPTGNLDSAAGKEIMKLLKEVAKEKLVIVVTHNFDEIKEYATRQIRIFEGGVEFDHLLKDEKIITEKIKDLKKDKSTFKKAFKLGLTRFMARPKLTLYLILLMIVATFALTCISLDISKALDYFKDEKIFTHYDGRLILTKKDRTTFTDLDFQKINENIECKKIYEFDYFLDQTQNFTFSGYYNSKFKIDIISDDMKLDLGSMPTNASEVVVNVAIGFIEGENFLTHETLPYTIKHDNQTLKITGVKFFYDNTKDNVMYFTKEGYDIFASEELIKRVDSIQFNYELDDIPYFNYVRVCADESMAPNTYTYIDKTVYEKYKKENTSNETSKILNSLDLALIYLESDVYLQYQKFYLNESNQMHLEEVDLSTYNFKNFPNENISLDEFYAKANNIPTLFVSKDILCKIVKEQIIEKTYTQASIFLKNDKVATSNIKNLEEMGYFAYLSSSTKAKDALQLFEGIIIGVIFLIIGFLCVLFISMLLYVCTQKAMASTKGDIAIMRSMGISTKVIKESIIVQLVLSVIPSVLVTFLIFLVIYLLPQTNYLIRFIHFKECIFILLLLIFTSYRLSRSYIKLMFSSSVKKTLKGGIKG